MKPAILLFCCCFFAFGQSTPPTPDTKTLTPASSCDQKPNTPGRQLDALDILSDTQGVDFGPYLQDVEGKVKENWCLLIPESASTKKGKLAIEFAITKDGKLSNMRLVASSGDVALDRPAWGAITASRPFAALPGEFTGPYLDLRFRFYYNPDKSDLDGSGDKTPPEPAHTNETTSAPSKSGVTVIISSLGDIFVPAGEWKVVTATVTGTKEQTVEWSVTGSGCSSPCGHMTGDLYFAPTVRPSPPVVTLTATSKADPTAKATVNIHIVEPSSKTVSNSTLHRVEVPVLATPNANPRPPGGVGGGIFHVGGGVSPPRAIYSPQPEYSEEASKAQLEGTCVLGLIVDVDGKVHNIKVLTPLGKGLDEKAINAVNTWEFEPAMKDGHPVRVEIAVEVSFHLDQKSEHPK